MVPGCHHCGLHVRFTSIEPSGERKYRPVRRRLGEQVNSTPLLRSRLALVRKECAYERSFANGWGVRKSRPRPPTDRPVIAHPSTNRASASKWDHFSAVEERPHPVLSNGPLKLGVCVFIDRKWFLPNDGRVRSIDHFQGPLCFVLKAMITTSTVVPSLVTFRDRPE